MNTLNSEIDRIKTACANIASKAFTGQDCQARVDEIFKSITSRQYEAGEKVWDELYRKRRELREELYKINREIQVVEYIIGLEIKD